MRPVNLLPQNDRATRPAEGLSGSSYVIVGALGALLLAVGAFVFTQNQVNDRTTRIAKVQAEYQQAEQRVETLGAFGSFANVKQQREQSVGELAKARFDWERFMRELALVLPSGTSLLDVTASTNTTADSGAGGAAQAPAAGETATPGSPTVKLVGCAVSQPRVATLLVRLRKLAHATEVDLTESAQEEGGGGNAGGAGAGADSAAETNTSCPPGKFKFDATVTFAPANEADEATPRKTPARLGGGA